MQRRAFLSVAAASAACSRSGAWRTLSDEEARTLAVLADQIVPHDEFPGAGEAGAVRYIDTQLARRYKKHRGEYSHGLQQAESIARERFGGALASLAPANQLAVAVELERAEPEFFSLVTAHTLQSFYGSPRHGGNRDAVSWRMMGVPPAPVRGRNLS